jgi:TolB-like protein/class 3 adenylate cyclase
VAMGLVDQNCNNNEERRLAAVAFIDIASYTILMSTDEERTHRRWMKILNDLVQPAASQRRGRVVKTTGDGALVEFRSALDAVEWAREVQQRVVPIQTQDDDTPPTIAFRIAVHIGDIITTELDVFGDGVNVAARLQEHSPIGGIVMSEAVYDLVRGRMKSTPNDLGPLELKNVEKPVRAYSVGPIGEPVLIPTHRHVETLPSIAVLPMQNLGGNPTDDYFAEGIIEDIIMSLSALRELFVISRASTLTYKGQHVDPRDIGRKLGVRYVLTGSIRRHSDKMRITVQLCDASKGANIWGHSAELALTELFEIQDQIVVKIVTGIAPNVRAAELRNALRKRPENFSAYDCTLRALHIISSLEYDTFALAREYLEKAMTADSNFSMPVAWAARWHSLNVGQGWSRDPTGETRRSMEFAAKAIKLDGENTLALATYGHLLSYLEHDYDSALVYFERALSICPNHSLAWLLYSGTLSYIGRGDEAVGHALHALRLSPFDQSLFYYFSFISMAHYSNGAYEEAVKWARMSARENPLFTANYRYLAAALAELNRVEEATLVGKQMLRLEPDFRLSEYGHTRQPFRDSLLRQNFLCQLSRAGLPL